jgi:hypothetical protein
MRFDSRQGRIAVFATHNVHSSFFLQCEVTAEADYSFPSMAEVKTA